MPVFQSVNRILIGPDRFSEMFHSSNHVLIVCDPFIAESNAIDYVTDKLKEMGTPYTVFSDVHPDPGTDLIAAGLTVIQEVKPDTLVGFGGGSAIDAAKAMIYFAKVQQFMTECTFIAIPTTSGTGSEVTTFSVITDQEKRQKYPLIDDSLLPDYALLDAQLTLTVPPAVTADTGMDVLTHAIEAMVSTKANDFTDAAAEKALRLVRDNLLTTYTKPDHQASRQAMHNASCLAGIAFSNAGLGLIHGMAHALGGWFHIPHGRANAVLLPYVIAFNGERFDRISDPGQPYMKVAKIFEIDSVGAKQMKLSLIRIVKQYMQKLQIPETIQGSGIAQDEFMKALPEMAAAAVKDSCTQTNPRTCTSKEVEAIYLHAFYGKVLSRE